MQLNVTETWSWFKIFDGDGALMGLIFLCGAVTVFNSNPRTGL
jgi:hypothetical protein